MKNVTQILAAMITLLAWQSAMGAEGSSEMTVNRMAKPLVTTVGLNNAGPAGIGIGVGYSILPWLKAEGGYSEMKVTTSVSMDGNGNVSTGETKYESYALGTQFAVPDWNLTPIGGLHVAHYSVKSDDTEATFNGMKEGSGTVVYTTLGASWQSHSGFITEAGINVPLGGHTQTAAFVDLGWAFNIL